MNFDKWTTAAAQSIADTQKLADQYSAGTIEVDHWLLVVLNDEHSFVRKIMAQAGVNEADVKDLIKSRVEAFPKVEGAQRQPSRDFAQMMTQGEKVQSKMKDEYLAVDHLFLALLQGNSNAKGALEKAGLTAKNVETAIKELRNRETSDSTQGHDKLEALEKYTVDFAALAESGKIDPIIGRDEEIRRTNQILSRRTKNNPVLAGDSGVGKTAIAEGLAVKHYTTEVPESLRNKRVLSLD